MLETVHTRNWIYKFHLATGVDRSVLSPPDELQSECLAGHYRAIRLAVSKESA